MEEEDLAMMLQFADSTLPVGGYAHSFGLEGMCQAGIVQTADELRLFLFRDVSHSLLTVDLPLMLRAYQAALDLDQAAIRHWDETAWAMRPTNQLREAASRIGRQTWMLYQKTWRALEGDYFVHYQAPIVSGVIFAERGAPEKAAYWTIVYQTFSALVQSALKLLPIGPAAAQLILRDALQKMAGRFHFVQSTKDTEIGSFNPLWDIAASQHERADARLFIS
jgi:urease accessory protein